MALMDRAADSFRLEVFYIDGTTASVIEANPMNGLYRLLELYPWQPGQRIRITPLYTADEDGRSGRKR
ncbi:hypothetical protein I4I73_06475 [Pseudonocardia sp. KRD-184]|uniref:Uncharacterized protein n=1 Tax=Pseudonocardia oceani TaxID=2792013 RepID=A0ABS6U2Z3_9PSEU|nr:hypothetical protein [Pseudonocardia oceani]MBW0088705.1 hypothetical protein [Pseudonocardia oceani]MBW0095644.1 hypothetical protein [Pseudonocardia oceani]MBW0121829.1 hypothetical protein [Pseudonocardia oceani]MBW0126615.1 hypothetical protein [Pseudonocardia oceani]